MIGKTNILWRRFYIIADALIIAGVYRAAYEIRLAPMLIDHRLLMAPADLSAYLGKMWLAVLIYLFAFYFFGFYKEYFPKTAPALIWATARGCLAGAFLFAASLYFLKVEFFSRLFLIIFASLLGLLIIFEKLLVLAAVKRLRSGKLLKRRILLVGPRERTAEVINLFSRHSRFGFEVAATIGPDGDANESGFPDTEVFQKELAGAAVDEVIFALPKNMLIDIEQYIWICEQMGLTVRIIANFFNLAFAQTYLDSIGSIPVLTYSATPRSLTGAFLKRAIDLGLGVSLLIAAAPLLAGASIKVRLGGKRLLIKKRVVGYHGREFELFEIDDLSGGWGRILKRLRIDHAPALINVIRGEMSMIGPQAVEPLEASSYDPWQRKRLTVRPGIIGLRPIEISDPDLASEGVRREIDYIDRWSIMLDLKLLIIAAWRAFFGLTTATDGNQPRR